MNFRRVSLAALMVICAACSLTSSAHASRRLNGDVAVAEPIVESPAMMEADAAAMDMEADVEPKPKPGALVTVGAIGMADEDFSTLIAAVTAADGATDDDALKLFPVLTGESESGITLFAPSNDAFTVALDMLCMTVDALLEDKDVLRTILQYHVATTKLTAEALMSGISDFDTAAAPSVIVVTVVDGVVMLNNTATPSSGVSVVAADVPASNGVVHVIDGVLLPATVADALMAKKKDGCPVVGGAMDTVEGIVGDVMDAVEGAVGGVVDAVEDIVSDVMDGAADGDGTKTADDGADAAVVDSGP